MLITAPQAPLSFPHAEPPAPGETVAIADGVLWTRFFLPFLLNHVNVYLLRGERGWVAVDTGIGLDDTRAAWERLFAGALGGDPIEAVVCTHFHPDHAGLVGWLTERFGCPLYMPRTEFLFSLSIQHRAFAANKPFYRDHGLPEETTERVATGGHGYLRLTTGLPTQFQRLAAGDTLTVGGRRFAVFTGGGHAPEQAMLHCAEEGIFLSADQVLSKISPNISVQAMEPDSDPLGAYLASLSDLRAALPEDALVLPGHHLPFHGLHARIDQLAAHHAERCGLILEACRTGPKTATELVPVVFHRPLDPHQMGFAFSEVVAHVNCMRTRGEIVQRRDADGVLRQHLA